MNARPYWPQWREVGETVVRYNKETMEYDLVDKLSRAVVESGFCDRSAAQSVADTYNEDS